MYYPSMDCIATILMAVYGFCLNKCNACIIYREIYKFTSSSQGMSTTATDCLLLLDKVEKPEGLECASVRTVRVSSTVMKKLSGMQSTDSIEAAALIKIPSTYFDMDLIDQNEMDYRSWFQSPSRILVLDGIQVNSLAYLEFSYNKFILVVICKFRFLLSCCHFSSICLLVESSTT